MSEDNPRSRVVFDCMIYLQATVSESGPAAALLRLVDRNALSLFVSNEILDEEMENYLTAAGLVIEEVITRPPYENVEYPSHRAYLLAKKPAA